MKKKIRNIEPFKDLHNKNNPNNIYPLNRIDKIIFIKNKSCSGLCGPTIIFLILSFVSIIGSLISKPKHYIIKKYIFEYKFVIFVYHIMFTIIWGGLLYFICSKCKQGIAWLILLIPIIIGIILMYYIYKYKYKVNYNNILDKIGVYLNRNI